MTALVQIGRAMFQHDDSLLDLFTQFDTNNDGVLQEVEFYSAMEKLNLQFSPELKKKLMRAVDMDGGHTIDYKEFVAAFSIKDSAEDSELAKGHVTWQQNVLQQMSNVFYQHRIHIRSAFRAFDKDHSGVISKDEFRAGIRTFNSLLNCPLTEEQIEELLNHLDKNNDGVLSYTEFFDGFQVVDVRPGTAAASADGTAAADGPAAADGALDG